MVISNNCLLVFKNSANRGFLALGRNEGNIFEHGAGSSGSIKGCM